MSNTETFNMSRTKVVCLGDDKNKGSRDFDMDFILPSHLTFV